MKPCVLADAVRELVVKASISISFSAKQVSYHAGPRPNTSVWELVDVVVVLLVAIGRQQAQVDVDASTPLAFPTSEEIFILPLLPLR